MMTKKFIIRVFLFLTPVFLVLLTFEVLVRNSNNIYKEKFSGLVAAADSVEMLVLGTSHADNGISSDEFDIYTYNMGLGSQSLYFDRAITRKFIPSLKALKYVLISIDYHSLYFIHRTQRDLYYNHYYGIQFMNNTYYKSDLSMFLYGYGIEKGFDQISMESYNLKKGWSDVLTETNYEELEPNVIQQRIDSNFGNLITQNKLSSPVIYSELEAFVVELLAQDITPIFLTLPCHKNFVNLLEPEVIRTNELRINQLAQKHNLDYWNYLTLALPDHFYYNADHLNKDGAKEVSGILNIRLRGLNEKK